MNWIAGLAIYLLLVGLAWAVVKGGSVREDTE